MTIEQMRNIKEERGYSMSQLSEYSGVPLGTLQKIFSGETKTPRKSTMSAIEKVLLGEESVYQGWLKNGIGNPAGKSVHEL